MSVQASVIMPCFNSERYISEAINSVLNQTFDELELLICDDGSSDKSLEIIKRYACKDRRIKFFQNPKTEGAAMARNRCIENATGRYICFLDSDDIWHLDRLKNHIDFMKKSSVYFSYSFNNIIDENGVYKHKYLAPEKVDSKKMRYACFLSCSTVIYDSHKLGKFYQPHLKKRNDFALWLTILNSPSKPIAVCYKKITSSYRVNSYGLSSNKIVNAYYYYKCQIDYNNQSKFSAMYFLFIHLFIILVKKAKPKLYNKLVTHFF